MYRVPINEDWSFIVGKELIQICVGPFDVQLHFTDRVCISVHGENPAESFRHSTDILSSSAVRGMPGRAVSLVSLLGTTTEKVFAENDKTLAICFSNKEELRMYDSSDVYESFTISGPRGLIVI